MAQQGATLQKFNNELVKCLEDLKEKRDTLNRAISKEEEMKIDITKKLHKLTEQLHKLNESLAAKVQVRTGQDRTEHNRSWDETDRINQSLVWCGVCGLGPSRL